MNTNPGLLGRKIGMTQIFDENGSAVPVTAVEAGPCTVLQVKVSDELLKRAQGARARYELVHGRTSKPMRGHFFKAGETTPQRFVREIRMGAEQVGEYEAGQQVTLDAVFEQGDFVDVVGTSKGRGFTGVVKRHGFAMFPKTHGTHEWTRHGGSIGCRKPMHVRKGQRMAGQHGNRRVTVQNLRVAALIPEQNVILIRGAVPGPNGGYLVIRKAIKRQKK